MKKPELTRTRMVLALCIAMIADMVQIPDTFAAFTGVLFIPAELADIVTDAIVMIATVLLLGFHWALLPSLLTEVIPGLDLFPTWTACVTYVIWQRRKESEAIPPIVEVEVVTDEPNPPTAKRLAAARSQRRNHQ